MKRIQTVKAPKAIGPYVQGNIVGNLLFASGQIPLNPDTGEIVGTTISTQTHQVMKNIAGLLEEIEGGFDQIIKTTCFLKNMQDFEAFNQVYATYFSDHFPARSTVEVARLPKNVLIEIEIIAQINH